MYDSSFLVDPDGYDLDPGLVRQSGQQYVEGLPGAFSDSAPDRWGRNLIDKRRRSLQLQSDRRLPTITDVDYLTAVNDATRQGNLRFSDGEGPFLSPSAEVPKLVSLPRLLASADTVSRSGAITDFSAIKDLLDAGSGSLGGAGPKASVRADDGGLLVAKFPHADDQWDAMAWEKTMLDMARACGLSVPNNRLASVGARKVLLLERFDRAAGGARVGYVSAMTLLGARDGDERDYADIAETLPETGAAVREDLAELFARVVFNVAVHNTDDHLRNHGFIRQSGGWKLSPMFDVNPNPDLSRQRVTGILGMASAEAEVSALQDFASMCRLSKGQANEIISRVVCAVGEWRTAASSNGIPASELSLFEFVIGRQLAALAALTN